MPITKECRILVYNGCIYMVPFEHTRLGHIQSKAKGQLPYLSDYVVTNFVVSKSIATT